MLLFQYQNNIHYIDGIFLERRWFFLFNIYRKFYNKYRRRWVAKYLNQFDVVVDFFNFCALSEIKNVGKAKNVLFFAAHNHPVKEQDAIDALDILEKKFPGKNIDLIVVDCKDNYKGVETVRINNHIDLIKMEFHTGKDIYSDKQEEFTQILSDRRLGSAWQRMGRKRNNATFKIKRFVVNTLCCLIPNKKWRKSIRRKFDVSTQMFERK